MKICIISPSRQHLQEAQALLRSMGHEVRIAEGGKSRLPDLVERERPDVAVVDGMCCDLSELQHVELATSRHPSLEVLLLCSTQVPEFLLGAMRAGVREVLPSPPPGDQLRAAVDRIAGRRQLSGGSRSGRVLAFIPSKGGCGATFLATNLAWELAAAHKVLLLDLNLQFGDALAFVHDGRAASTLADVARDISRLDATLLDASTTKVGPKLSVLPAPEDISQAVEIGASQIDAILAIALTQYEFVLVDLPRSLDPVTVRTLDLAERVYLVLQAALPDLRNANRLMESFRGLGYDDAKTEAILNRFERSSEIGVEQIQRTLGGIKIHTVANSYRDVHASISHGEPLGKTARGNAVVRQLDQIVQSVQPRPETAKGLLSRLFRTA